MHDGKIIILIGDGMSDYPVPELGMKTPLEAAETPNMDSIAMRGICGLARTVPDGMQPGSDVANLAIFGYDPRETFTGRAPLEALNMGIPMDPDDVAFRCNIVSIGNGVMEDFSAGHIDTPFSEIIMKELEGRLARGTIEFHPGVSYRNIVMWRKYPHDSIPESTPPHDIHGKNVSGYLPRGKGSDLLRDLMAGAEKIILDSDIIKNARLNHKGNPSSIWLWGGGKKPSIRGMRERFGLHGHTISAVDLINGIGRAAGLTPVRVEGATGYIDTNYEGKADACIETLEASNFVFLHVESPDESGHEGNLAHKMQSIRDFDERVVGRVLRGIEKYKNYCILVMPDHPTPLSLRTHSSDPVPFCMYRKKGWEGTPFAGKSAAGFNEKSAAGTGLFIEQGHRLIELMIHGHL